MNNSNAAMPHQPVNITSPAQLANRTTNRPLYIFDVPEKVVERSGIRKIGLIELTAEEELLATKRSHNDMARLAFELAKESLRQIDGKPVSTADGTADVVWNNMGAALRTLIIGAYQSIHNPTEVDAMSFMKSRQVTLG